jgi:hypothetical protein
MTNTNKQVTLSGNSLKEQADHACSLAALQKGNWHHWVFAGHTGLVYATADYCVFFNERNEAFTGSMSLFADHAWKMRFMACATTLYQNRMNLWDLFELMAAMPIDPTTGKLDFKVLNDYVESLDRHLKETGGIL